MKQIRWGIIGCGNVTELKSGPAFNKVRHSSLVAVMRRDAAKAEDYARRHQVPRWYTNAEQLINDTGVDAVYIATPPDSHKDYALMVAAAGKICCVEKPMALNSAECEEMTAAFADQGLPLYVAYYRRSLPRFLQIKQWLQQQLIGEPRQVQWSFSRTPSAVDQTGQYNWRTDPAKAGGGYFIDLASHGLDLLLYLLGDVVQVKGIQQNQQQLYKAEDAVAAVWQFQSGCLGSGFWNFAAAQRSDQVVIYGSKGRIEFSVFEQAPVQLFSNTQQLSLTIEHPEHIQFYHIEAMVQDLLFGTGHPSTGVTASRASWMMEQILKSKPKL
jgi:1,5-anhydro-D-fructose reductase (1,5-anhydro-D-mannitol-forming)